jgi:hypothetical protein
MKRAVLAALIALTTIVAPVSAGLTGFNVFPNPFRPSRGHTTVTFDNISGGGEIKIYNTAGRLVFEKTLDASQTSFVWDVKNTSGKNIASGIYVYYVESTGEQRTGKLGVMR